MATEPSPLASDEGLRVLMVYRLLGHERVALTGKEIEMMVRDGLLTPDTKVVCEGERFATAISARPEFRHLLGQVPKHPRSRDP